MTMIVCVTIVMSGGDNVGTCYYSNEGVCYSVVRGVLQNNWMCNPGSQPTTWATGKSVA